MTESHKSPLLSADPKATLVFSAEKNGSLRVLYQGWDEPKVFPPGGGVEVVAKGGKVLVFRKEPTPAEVAEATSDPYEDWDPAPLAEPVPPAPTGQNDRPSGTPLADFDVVEGSPLEPIGQPKERQ